MYKAWFRRWFRLFRALLEGWFQRPVATPAALYDISASDLSPTALKVTQQLQAAGFSALIVGGAVRDLVLRRRPKDFDVATNATPEEVQQVFGRRARIIGRRFRIVHVVGRREKGAVDVIEITTFRGVHAASQAQSETGRLLRDNVWGNRRQDAERRDFTANALYYDPKRGLIYDYHQGLRDLNKRMLVMIGDPAQRFREDPVRILRAVRLAAKLALTIEDKTAEPMQPLSRLLGEVPIARLFDELQKLLISGAAEQGIVTLHQRGLYQAWFPQLGEAFAVPAANDFILLAMRKTDARVAEGKTVNPGFQLAALLWPPLKQKWQYYEQMNQSHLQALLSAIEDIVHAVRRLIPARLTAVMREIWALQPRFEYRHGQRPFRLREHARFRAAMDFLALRAEAEDTDPQSAIWWLNFDAADSAQQAAMVLPPDTAVGKKRRRRGSKAQPNAAAPAVEEEPPL